MHTSRHIDVDMCVHEFKKNATPQVERNGEARRELEEQLQQARTEADALRPHLHAAERAQAEVYIYLYVDMYMCIDSAYIHRHVYTYMYRPHLRAAERAQAEVCIYICM